MIGTLLKVEVRAGDQHARPVGPCWTVWAPAGNHGCCAATMPGPAKTRCANVAASLSVSPAPELLTSCARSGAMTAAG